MDESALARVEQQRVELETNISRLRNALRHWQTLEIDYEGLREEFAALPESCSADEALQAAKAFAPELIDEKELKSLIVTEKATRIAPKRLIDLLSKRVDYVTRNISTLQKQLSGSEKKRNALLLAEEPDYREDAGLPLTEVTEELDDDGNVISSKIETAESAAPHLMEVLKRAGVKDLVDNNGIITTTVRQPSDSISSNAIESSSNKARSSPKEVEPPMSLQSPLEKSHTKEVTSVIAKSGRVNDSTTSEIRTNPKSSEPSQDTHSKQIIITDTQAASSNPEDTEEDAKLRREMLEYGLGEVGAIVAELDLEEDASDVSFDEDEDEMLIDSDDDDDDDIDEDESEDEFGMTKRPVISDKYRRKMARLQKKLGIQGMQNLGPNPDIPIDLKKEIDREPEAENVQEHEKKSKVNIPTPPNDDKRSKKKVAFASSLDIAPSTVHQIRKDSRPTKKLEISVEPPIRESVIERSPGESQAISSPASASPQKKTSRFKSARQNIPQTPLLPPPKADLFPVAPSKEVTHVPANQIMSSTILERENSGLSGNASPPDPDDFDEALHKQQIAGDYYKLRNRMIQRQGGFVRDGEGDNYGEFTAPIPVVDEETGKVKRVSRFKAARLK